MGIVGIFIGIILVVFLTYRGWNVIVAAPLAAIAVIVCNQIPLTASITDTFMGGASGFVKTMLLIYVSGTMLGEVYNVSGAATSVATWVIGLLRGKDKSKQISEFSAIFVIFAASFILAFGGIHVVALTFVMLPLALEIMREADIPRVLAPALVMGCILTAVPCMPFSPGTQNVIPMTLLGTSSSVAMVPGIIGGVFVLALNLFYLTRTAKKMKAAGQSFNTHALPAALAKDEEARRSAAQKELPNPILSLIPLIVIFVLFNAFKMYVVFAIVIGIALTFLLLFKHIDGWAAIVKILGNGASNACVVLLAGASMSGFGALVSSVESFQVFANGIASFQGPALLMVAVSTMIITAVSGSGPAGLNVVLPMFTNIFTSMGISLNAIHRIASFASTTLDTMPTNAIFIASSGITGVSVKDSYKYVFFATVVNTSLATFLVVAVLTLFPGLA